MGAPPPHMAMGRVEKPSIANGTVVGDDANMRGAPPPQWAMGRVEYPSIVYGTVVEPDANMRGAPPPQRAMGRGEKPSIVYGTVVGDDVNITTTIGSVLKTLTSLFHWPCVFHSKTNGCVTSIFTSTSNKPVVPYVVKSSCWAPSCAFYLTYSVCPTRNLRSTTLDTTSTSSHVICCAVQTCCFVLAVFFC